LKQEVKEGNHQIRNLRDILEQKEEELKEAKKKVEDAKFDEWMDATMTAIEDSEPDGMDYAGKYARKYEGFRDKLYECPAGKLTIGWGHNIEDRGLSREACDFILGEDLAQARMDALSYLGDECFNNLSPIRQGVIIDMSLNLGLPTLSKFKQLKRSLEVCDYSGAASAMLDSKWAKQVKGRATQHAERMRTGEEV
jgi:lysozyme